MSDEDKGKFVDVFMTILCHYMKSLHCEFTLREFIDWGFDDGDENNCSLVDAWNKKHGEKFLMRRESNAWDDLPQMIMLYKMEHP